MYKDTIFFIIFFVFTFFIIYVIKYNQKDLEFVIEIEIQPNKSIPSLLT